MTVLLTGGSGLLGRELLRLDPSILAPPRKELDVRRRASVESVLERVRPELVIHAAAFTDDRAVRKDPALAVESNILGTSHVALACLGIGARLVYLSTDYVYPGDRGNYREDDPLLPFNPYAWTKLGGECAVRNVPNHLIIRTTFGAPVFPYEEAFTDKWTSKDDVAVLAPKILAAARSDLTGVLNVGTERKTIYDLATRARAGMKPKEIRPVSLSDRPGMSPPDTSFDLTRWETAVREGRIKP